MHVQTEQASASQSLAATATHTTWHTHHLPVGWAAAGAGHGQAQDAVGGISLAVLIPQLAVEQCLQCKHESWPHRRNADPRCSKTWTAASWGIELPYAVIQPAEMCCVQHYLTGREVPSNHAQQQLHAREAAQDSVFAKSNRKSREALTYQRLCTARCSYAGSAFADWLCEQVPPVAIPAQHGHQEFALYACQQHGLIQCQCIALEPSRTAALATAKLASLDTAFTSPSDLMMRLTRASGSTCTCPEHVLSCRTAKCSGTSPANRSYQTRRVLFRFFLYGMLYRRSTF